MNENSLPPLSSADDLLRLLQSSDNWPAKLAELRSEQTKVVAKIKELEGIEKSIREQSEAHRIKVEHVNAAIGRDMSEIEKQKADVAVREKDLLNRVDDHDRAVKEHVANVKAHEDAAAIKEAELRTRERAVADKELAAAAAYEKADALKSDFERRLAIVKKAQE